MYQRKPFSFRGVAWSIAVGAIVLLLMSCGRHRLAPDANPTAAQAPGTLDLLLADRFADLNQHLSVLQNAYHDGKATDRDLRDVYRAFYDTDPKLAIKYDTWVSQFPASYVAHLARGIYYERVGDNERGVDTIAETASGRLDAADSAYETALKELTASIALDQKPILSYSNVILILMGRGDLQEKRRWLDRANAIDPHNYVARASYMSAIETRWGGSQEIMRAFLEECRAAGLPEEQMQLLESVVAEDDGWTHQFMDHDYAAAEAAYRKSGALGGDKQLTNLAGVLIEQKKYRDALEPLTEKLQLNPNDFRALTSRETPMSDWE